MTGFVVQGHILLLQLCIWLLLFCFKIDLLKIIRVVFIVVYGLISSVLFLTDEDEESGVEEEDEDVEEGPSEEEADEDDESESGDDSGPDLARGKGNIETSSDEDDDDDGELEEYLLHEEEELEHDWGEMWKDAPSSDNVRFIRMLY